MQRCNCFVFKNFGSSLLTPTQLRHQSRAQAARLGLLRKRSTNPAPCASRSYVIARESAGTASHWAGSTIFQGNNAS